MNKDKIRVKVEQGFPSFVEYEKFLIEKGVLEKDSSGKLRLSEKTYAKVFIGVVGLSTVFNTSSADEILGVCSRHIDETYGFDILKKTTSYQDLVDRVKELQDETKKVS
jgi:hypothetical protein